MKIIHIELVGILGGIIDSRIVNVAEGDDEAQLINDATLELVRACILNPGDSIRISEYQ
jgi:hypothetical protein